MSERENRPSGSRPSKTGFGRRRFLVGAAGATVALPTLNIWLERDQRASAQAAPPQGFAVFVRAGNGIQQAWNDEPERFWPTTAGSLNSEILSTRDSGRAVSELAAFGAKLNLLRGVNRPFGTQTCGHSESIVQCLTASRFVPGSANDALSEGVSADWIIARALNEPGREPLTMMAGPDQAYIAEALSWSAPRTRTSAERSPLNLYMRMMGLSSAPPELQTRIAARRMSVNDLVRGQMQELLGRSEFGTADRMRLQQHFDSIRDMENRMSCDLDPAIVSGVQGITNPQGNDVRPEVVERFAELTAFAFSCGLNHAATIQVGEGNDQTRYYWNGTELPRFHWISHRIYADGSDGEPIPNAVELHHQVDRIQLRMYAHLLGQLDSYPSATGTGTLLDDSVAVWLNDLGNGPPHSGDNVPWLLGGGGNLGMRTGQYLQLSNARINQVLNTILTAVGVRKDDGSDYDDFGDSGLSGGLIREIKP